MEAIKKDILELLSSEDPTKIFAVREKLSDEDLGLFEEALSEVVGEVLTPAMTEYCAKLAEGEPSLEGYEITDPELFKSLQEKLIPGEADEPSLRLVCAVYKLAGGDVRESSSEETVAEASEEEKPEVPVLTFGELYGLGEDDPLYAVEAKLSTDKRNSLPDGAFCGPNRSFPVHDRAHVVAALRLLGRYKGPGDKERIRACIMRKAKKFGIGTKDGESLVFHSAVLEGLDGEYILLPDFIIENGLDVDILSDVYLLNEREADHVSAYISATEQLAEKAAQEELDISILDKEDHTHPLVLGVEHLHRIFSRYTETAKSAEDSDYLLPLVGVARKLGLSKSEIEEFSGPYSIFSRKVLERLYKKLPEASEKTVDSQVDKAGESSEGTQQIVVVEHNPVLDEPEAQPVQQNAEESEDFVASYLPIRRSNKVRRRSKASK